MVMRHHAARIATGILLAAAQPMAAGAADTPDPPVSGLYHLEGIDEDVARGDFMDCLDAASGGLSLHSRVAAGGDYGFVGSLFADLYGKAGTNRLRNASLQQCMVLRGYRLMLVSEADWRRLLGVDDALQVKSGKEQADVIDALAAFAARPLPDDPALRG